MRIREIYSESFDEMQLFDERHSSGINEKPWFLPRLFVNETLLKACQPGYGLSHHTRAFKSSVPP